MTIRSATSADHANLLSLYRAVAQIPNGIARTPDEITDAYIASLLTIRPPTGLQVVLESDTGQLIGEMHASKYGLRIFDHILTHLTIVIHPDYQGKGFGKALFTRFLSEIKQCFPELRRVELEARASNEASLALYRQLGFEEEGIYRYKTRNSDGRFVDSVAMALLLTDPDAAASSG